MARRDCSQGKTERKRGRVDATNKDELPAGSSITALTARLGLLGLFVSCGVRASQSSKGRNERTSEVNEARVFSNRDSVCPSIEEKKQRPLDSGNSERNNRRKKRGNAAVSREKSIDRSRFLFGCLRSLFNCYVISLICG